MKFSRLILCYLAVAILIFSGIEIKEILEQNSHVVKKVLTTHKVVALTFDDGPSNKTTQEILAILKEKKVKATFFVVGENVEQFPNMVAQEVSEGHEIGIHTYDHKSLPTLNNDRIREELEKSEKAVAVVTAKPTLFRPPGGLYNETVLNVARDRGYTVILWSVDPRDWSAPPVNDIVENVMKNVKPGSIVLLHDLINPSPTPGALSIIIDRLKEQGYEFDTVSELLQYYEVRTSYDFLDSD